jgi:hypothetical protein
MNNQQRSEIFWGSAPGLSMALTIWYAISVFRPQSAIGFVTLVTTIIIIVDLLQEIGLPVTLKYARIAGLVYIVYLAYSFSVVRWGLAGLVLFVLAFAIFKILRNRKGYLSAVKSFDTYLKKWDPKWGEKK